MDLVLAGLHWSHCLVYIDDIVILGRSYDEHLANLGAVFTRIGDAGLKLQPAMDLLGPLPESEAGNSYVLVVADYFTRWMEAFALPNQEASTVAKASVVSGTWSRHTRTRCIYAYASSESTPLLYDSLPRFPLGNKSMCMF